MLLLRPINKLVSTRIAASDFSTRTSSQKSRLSKLATAFNNRKWALEALRESEEQFRLISENMGEVLWMAALGGRPLIYVNPMYEQMWGRTRESLYEQPRAFIEGIHPEDRERTIAAFGKRNQDQEYRVVRPDGSVRWARSRTFPICDQAGEVYRNIGLVEDITERKRAEEALRESESRLSLIYASVADLIFLVKVESDDRYLCISVNRAYLENTGLSQEQLIGRRVEAILPGPAANFAIAKYKEAVQTGKTLQYEESVDLPRGRVLVETTLIPILDQEGNCTHLLGVAHDITARKQAEAEIRQLNETLEQRVRERTAQLEAANQELDSFSYSVSHDLRAPLRHIRGFVDALARQLEPSGATTNPKVAHYIEVIQDSSQKMGQLIDGLLTLSHVGRQQLANHPVNLRQLVDSASALVMDQIATSEDSVEFNIGNLPTVIGDPTLLQQVFNNLIDNAIKFSHGRYPAKIEVGATPDEIIFVKDNGVGFQMEYADQLFGAFQRLHSQKDFKGTGIGLAIVQRIIHRHGGTIWAESAPNQGATFYFKLRSE